MTYKGFRISAIGNVYYKITALDGRTPATISGFLSEDHAKKYIDDKYLWKEDNVQRETSKAGRTS